MALAWRAPAGVSVAAAPLPLNGHLVDIHAVHDFAHDTGFVAVRNWQDLAMVVVEEQSARPGDGLKGLNYLLPQYGQIIGAFNALGITVIQVKPQQWKKLILHGTAKDKIAAIEHVTLRHPAINLRPGRRRNAHDGMADAVCIAEFGLQIMRPADPGNGSELL
jgi:hypothetical protein